jgi:L-ascorbate metabolism protein UlaG (beta-lactamase superfamily)
MANDTGNDGRLAVIWHGHSCIELQTPGGTTVLIDPWFANPRSPKAAADVDRCDVMLVTHGHFDHLGDAVEIAARTKPTWPCIHEISLWLGAALPELGDRVIGFNKGGTVAVNGLRVTMTPADHSGGSWDESHKVPLYLGEPAGFVIELEDGRRIYDTGDTALFSDLGLAPEAQRPDLLMLPIGGHYTMGPRDAAHAIELIGAKRVLPLHWGTFPILAGTPDALRTELAARGLRDVEVLTPEPGETLVLD